jgi:hypothetical protein
MRDCCQTCDPICPCSEAFDRGPGDARSAEDWDELLLPEIERQQAEVAFRARTRRSPIGRSRRRSGSGALRKCRAGSWGDRATAEWSGTRTFSTKRFLGKRRGGQRRRGVLRGTVPAGRLYRQKPEPSQSGSSAVLYWRGAAEQWIKVGKQATIGPDYRVVGSAPMKHAYTVAPADLQDELRAAVGQGWRATGGTRAELLAVAGRRTHRPPAVWPDAAADRGAPGPSE